MKFWKDVCYLQVPGVKLGEVRELLWEVQCQEHWGFLPLACDYRELLKIPLGMKLCNVLQV